MNRSKCIPVLAALVALLLTSCATKAPHYDFRELARAAIALDLDIAPEDNHQLYVTAAEWIGVPYRAGGRDHRGTDCSGLVCQLFRKAYHRTLQPNAELQRTKDCLKISKKHLQEGDLVFFHNGCNRRTASHVGIYLKGGRFIHASTTHGVIVSRLSEPYYQRHWLQGGRVIR